MTASAYTLSLVLLLGTVLPAAVAARALRRALLGGWPGAPALLADVVLALALLVIVCEIVGALGAFRATVITGASIVMSALVTLAATRLTHLSGEAREPAQTTDTSMSTLYLCLGGAALVVGEWLVAARSSLMQGMTTTDTLWYHMPFAAGFVQQASLTQLHFVELQPSTAYYPANSELLHGLGIALFSSHDILSPLLNLGFLLIVLLAGWCIGRPWGVAPLSMLASALAVSQPVLWANNAGQAGNDIVALAFFLSAVALLVNAGNRGPAIALAAGAAGLAAGTKLTLIGPVVALTTLSLALAPRGARLVGTGGWLLGTGVMGGFWYVRNLFLTGSPAPWFGVHLGPISWSAPPRPLNEGLEFSVAHYLTDWSVWNEYLLPGLKWGLGWAWWAVLALAAAGALGSVLARGSRVRRGLGLVAIASAVSYVLTPNGAAGHEGAPWSFGLNLRYALPAVALGLTLLPTWMASAPGRRRQVALAALLATLLATLGIRTTLWHQRREAVLFALAIAAAGALLWLVLARRRRVPLLAGAATAAAVAAFLAGGWFVQRQYLRERYSPGTFNAPAQFGFARDLRRARIALFGSVVGYQLYGRHLSNRVVYVGRRRPHGGFTALPSCRAWRAAINRGRYRYVVVAPVVSPNLPWGNSRSAPAELAWTGNDAAVRPLTPAGSAWGIFRIAGRLSPERCAALTDKAA